MSGSRRQAMSRRAIPSAWKLVEIATFRPQRSSVHRSTSCGVAKSRSTAIWPASNSSNRSRSSASRAIAVVHMTSTFLIQMNHRDQLFVLMAGEELLEGFVLSAPGEPGADEAFDHPV